MLKINRIFLFIVFSFLFICCSYPENRPDEISTGELVFPPVLYSPGDSSGYSFYEFGQKWALKLVVTTDGDCGSCFANLVKWQNYLEDYKKVYGDISFCAVLQTGDTVLTHYYLDRFKLSFPVFIDTLKMFCQSNNLPEEQVYTLLLDKDNNVIYNHSPFESKREHRKILRLIKRYRERDNE